MTYNVYIRLGNQSRHYVVTNETEIPYADVIAFVKSELNLSNTASVVILASENNTKMAA